MSPARIAGAAAAIARSMAPSPRNSSVPAADRGRRLRGRVERALLRPPNEQLHARRLGSRRATSPPSRCPRRRRTSPTSDRWRRRRRPCSDGPSTAAPNVRRSRPSTIQISHSGRARSRCWENTRAAIVRSCASAPRRGHGGVAEVVGDIEVADRRPTPARTRRAARTAPSGGSAECGGACRRTISRSSSNDGGGPSKMLTPPMCIGVTSFSTCRNVASCALIDCTPSPRFARAAARPRGTRAR